MAKAAATPEPAQVDPALDSPDWDALAVQAVPEPLDAVQLWDRNPRFITEERFEALKASMRADPRMLLARPLIALVDGRVIAGNMRLKAAQDLGWETIPVVRVDLDDVTATTWALRDNNPYGEYEEQPLAELIAELDRANVDLSLTGFADDELRSILDSMAEVPPDPDPFAPQDRGTDLALSNVSIGDPEHQPEKGDVWQVGPHFLVVAGVYDGWQTWVELLEGDVLFVPYPTPTLPFTDRAQRHTLVMVQPDPWLAGHMLDKHVSVRGKASVKRLDSWGTGAGDDGDA